MAYNTSKGGRELGDIKNEDDVDTQIDFGSDSITFKTNDISRLLVNNSHVSSSVNVSASAFYTNFEIATGQLTASQGGYFSGRVGIGTNSPDGNLHVWGASAGSVTVTGQQADGIIVENDDSTAITLLDPSGGVIYFGDADDTDIGRIGYRHGGDYANSLYFTTNNSQRMTIDSSGRLGIGLSSPTHTLTVVGAISGSSTIYAASSISSSLNLAVTGAVHANTYYGDGSNLTGVSAGSVSGSARIYSVTGVETSGYLKVTGSSTFTGATTFNSAVTASQGIRLPDNKSASFGNAADFSILHNATNTKLTNTTGHVLIDNQATSKDIRFILGSDSAATEAVKIRNNSDNNVWVCDAAGNVSGSGKLELAGTGSVSGDFNVTGTFSVGSTAQINNTLTLSGAASEALRITKDDASAREIVFENGGTDKVSIYMNSAENFFIRQEDSSKDINLRVGTTNAVVVDGSATEVAFAWDTSHVAISGSGNLKVGGSVSASADVYVTGAVSANTYYGDGSNLTGISAGSVSGSARIYSTTGIETSGYLNVTGNIDSAGDLTAATITMNGFVVDADGDTNLKSLRVDDGSFVGCDSDTDLMRLSSNTLQINGTLSGSGILYAAGAANFSSTVAATGSVSGAGLISSGQISGSSTMQIVGNTSIGGNLGVTGSFRAKQLHFTQHAYATTQTSEKWIPFYTLSEANAPNNATYINQMTVPFDGILKRVIFRPSGSQGGGTSRITLFKASDQSGLVNTDEGGVYVEHVDSTCAGTVSTKNIFNFTGSSHFSAGDVVGISIDPHSNPVEVNVSCIWEFDSTSLQ